MSAYALEQELLRLFRPEVVETIMAAALAELDGEPDASRLRRIVGARLLDELADALTRAQSGTAEQTFERVAPGPHRDEDTVSVQLPDANRVRDRRTRRWTPASELSRRAG